MTSTDTAVNRPAGCRQVIERYLISRTVAAAAVRRTTGDPITPPDDLAPVPATSPITLDARARWPLCMLATTL